MSSLSESEEAEVAKVGVFNHVTLDGVVQAPGRAEEDTRGGFERGGWASARMDEVMGRVMSQDMNKGGALLLGRRTYEDFYEYWPKQPDNPISRRLDNVRKYVASRTFTEPLPWSNSLLLGGDAVDTIAKLKADSDHDLTILGSGELIGSLIAADLIDSYVLMIHPLVLGSGRRLWPEGAHVPLRLTDSVTTTTGVVIATYERAGNSLASTERRRAA